VRANLALNLYADGSLDEAVRLMDAALASNRVHYKGSTILAQGLRFRATVAASQGDADLAKALLDEAEAQLKMSSAPSDAPWRANRERLDAATVHMFAGRAGAALEVLGGVVAPGAEVSPLPTAEVERDVLRSRALLAQGDVTGSIEAARQATARIEASELHLEWPALLAEARTQHARALCQADNQSLGTSIAQAAAEWRRAHDADESPWTAEAETVLATCLLRAGRTSEARPLIDAALGRVAAHKKLARYLSEPVQTLAGTLR
jgi:tetratricopeptide (TPR) repeat protein